MLIGGRRYKIDNQSNDGFNFHGENPSIAPNPPQNRSTFVLLALSHQVSF